MIQIIFLSFKIISLRFRKIGIKNNLQRMNSLLRKYAKELTISASVLLSCGVYQLSQEQTDDTPKLMFERRIKSDDSCMSVYPFKDHVTKFLR